MKETEEKEAAETAVQQTAAEEKPAEDKKFNGKKWGILGGIAAVIAALIVGNGIYNTPENRLQRQLDLGNRYLQEQNYTEAALAFEKAITIDERCMAAYAGGVEAYLGADDIEGAKTFYDKTLAMLSGLDADYVTANKDDIVGLYLSAEKVYVDDPEKVAEILEDACQLAGEDQRLKVKLIETYIGIAKDKTEGGAYEEALVIYDRLIELDRENADMIADLSDCLNRYIELLMQGERYDEIRALAEKYGDIVTGVDFAAILEQIEKRKTWVDVSPELFTFQIAGYDLWGDHAKEMGDILRSLAVTEIYGVEDSYGFYAENDVGIDYYGREYYDRMGFASDDDRDSKISITQCNSVGLRLTGEVDYSVNSKRTLMNINGWSGGREWEPMDFEKYIHCPVGRTAEEWYSLIGREQIVSRGQETEGTYPERRAWRFQTEWGEGYYEEGSGERLECLLAIDCSAEKGDKQIYSLRVIIEADGRIDYIWVCAGADYAWHPNGLGLTGSDDKSFDVFHIF